MNSDDDVFERLKSSVEPAGVSSREEAMRARITSQYEKAQERLAQLIDENSTLPATLAHLKITGTVHTRESFLRKVVAPALAAEKQQNYTLASILEEVQTTNHRLQRFGIFHPNALIYLDRMPQNPLTPDAPPALAATLTMQERGRLSLRTGTDIGSNDASGYTHVELRNLLGGAESVSLSLATGLRERAIFDLILATPVNANPDTVLTAGVSRATRSKWYSSHEEMVRSLHTGLRFVTALGQHSLSYTGSWRKVTGLGDDASAALRAEAGDSVKSSLTHTVVHERRDDPRLPTRGYMLRHSLELAGIGGLGGDAVFAKSEAEAQRAFSLPLGCSLSAGVRAGGITPLADPTTNPTRLPDRFILGGPTDVRGFKEAGIGPAGGVGGDVYAAFGASLFAPLPRLGPEHPLRLQAFVNGGRLVAAAPERGGVSGALKELTNGGLPSTAVGIGICYAHPLARFELNFCLPVVKRDGERARKGLQFGVGLEYL